MAKVTGGNVEAPAGVRANTLKRGKLVEIVDPNSILRGKLGMVTREGVSTFGGGVADQNPLVQVLPKGYEVKLTQR